MILVSQKNKLMQSKGTFTLPFWNWWRATNKILNIYTKRKPAKNKFSNNFTNIFFSSVQSLILLSVIHNFSHDHDPTLLCRVQVPASKQLPVLSLESGTNVGKPQPNCNLFICYSYWRRVILDFYSNLKYHWLAVKVNSDINLATRGSLKFARQLIASYL